jgi:hypothetical protein
MQLAFYDYFWISVDAYGATWLLEVQELACEDGRKFQIIQGTYAMLELTYCFGLWHPQRCEAPDIVEDHVRKFLRKQVYGKILHQLEIKLGMAG